MPNRRTAQEIEEGWDEQIENTINKSKEGHEKEIAGLFTLLMFMGTYQIFKGLPAGDLEKLAIRQRARYDIHTTMEEKNGPWNFSPTGYLEGNLINAILDTLKENSTNLQDIINSTSRVLPDEMKLLDQTLTFTDNTTQFGYHESTINGELSAYLYHDLGIPWTTCEDNNNCQSDSPVCDECDELSGTIFAVEDFFEAVHDFCRCNEPMADPILMNTT